MEFVYYSQVIGLLSVSVIFFFMVWKIIYSCWILPKLKYQKLRENGFDGPTPSFPLGNIKDMKELMKRSTTTITTTSPSLSNISNDIHALAFPYYALWQKLHGKVFIYWLGTEPFLYIADPEFFKKMSGVVMSKSWGKPKIFKRDRDPIFGNGLVMVEGDEWLKRRHVINPAFTPASLKGMASLVVESVTNMLDRWAALIDKFGKLEMDMENEITTIAAEIIAKITFGINYENGQKAFDKLRAMQVTLFKSIRYVGVPYGELMCPKEILKAKNLGKDIDVLLISIIEARKKMDKNHDSEGHDKSHGLLSLLMLGRVNNGADDRLGKVLSTRELVDECKTFFFGGHETSALALTWTMLLLALHQEWQTKLREEIKQVFGEGEIDVTELNGLKKMGWVMNEVLRLYPPAPNVQRQAREDIEVDNNLVIPKGTNIWIDIVSMHHDKNLWGEDANEFKPERFKDDMIYGGCKHKMGFLPFGFGGRMCIGRNLSVIEYKIVLSLILTRFSFEISPNYSHCPSILLSLRPTQGLPLVIRPL